MESNVKIIAEKWYKKLGYPEKYDEKFRELIATSGDFEEMKISDFDLEANKAEHIRNAVWALYFCEDVSHLYEERGIPEEILLDTLYDIRNRMMWYTDRVGKMGLEELSTWLYLHLKFENFKVGRLQYQIRNAGWDAPTHALVKGEPILAVHIPSGGPKLTRESALESFERAEEFFAKYFPEHEYKCFTCSSWLLDSTLKQLLKSDSNIVRFAELFDVVFEEEQYDCFKFGFPYGMTREMLPDFEPKTSLQAKIRDHILSGGKMNMGYGVRDKIKK